MDIVLTHFSPSAPNGRYCIQYGHRLSPPHTKPLHSDERAKSLSTTRERVQADHKGHARTQTID